MIEKCQKSKYQNGRHSWKPGGWRRTTCRFCGKKWVDVQIDPPPSAPLKVLITEMLEILKKTGRTKSNAFMPLLFLQASKAHKWLRDKVSMTKDKKCPYCNQEEYPKQQCNFCDQLFCQTDCVEVHKQDYPGENCLIRECHGCNFNGWTKPYEARGSNHDHYPQGIIYLCELCAGSPCGNAAQFPHMSPYRENREVLQTICFVGNAVLKQILENSWLQIRRARCFKR